MSNKTPYEIRLELLLIAKDFLQRQHEQAMAFAMEAFKKQLALGTAVAEDWKTLTPSMFTVEDILAKAQEMAMFVNGTAKKKSTE